MLGSGDLIPASESCGRRTGLPFQRNASHRSVFRMKGWKQEPLPKTSHRAKSHKTTRSHRRRTSENQLRSRKRNSNNLQSIRFRRQLPNTFIRPPRNSIAVPRYHFRLGALPIFDFWVAELVKSFDRCRHSPKVLTSSATTRIGLLPNLRSNRAALSSLLDCLSIDCTLRRIIATRVRAVKVKHAVDGVVFEGHGQGVKPDFGLVLPCPHFKVFQMRIVRLLPTSPSEPRIPITSSVVIP